MDLSLWATDTPGLRSGRRFLVGRDGGAQITVEHGGVERALVHRS